MAIITLSQYKHILLLVKKWQQKACTKKANRETERTDHAVKFFFSLDLTKFNAIYKVWNYHCRFRYQFRLIWMLIFDDEE